MTNNDECIEHLGSFDKKGYGKAGSKLAHRVAYETAHGPIPPGLCVCHSCDNRACVNIGHLWLGTNADNVRDRIQKGRSAHPRGALSGMSKYTQEQVDYIRAHPGPLSAIVKEIGISKAQASKIRAGVCW